MTGQTVRLWGDTQREFARRLIGSAPKGAVVNIREATRTTDQNAKMWAMLTDVSFAKCEGRTWTPDIWKAGFMSALNHEVLWQPGLDGRMPFPAGFKTSRLSKAQMSDLIELIYQYGAEHGVKWSDEQ